MQSYQREFLDFVIAQNILRFGEFTLKSGRKSPYFFNAGLFNSGTALAFIGRCYAQAIKAAGVEYDVLFGPAYKGIPLATATAIALSWEHDDDRPYCFNRKEIKDHGEGGAIVGADLSGRVLIIDDVITAGTAIRECMDIISQAGASAAAVVVALDRQEKGQGELSAIQEVERDYGIPVISIISLSHVISYLGKENNKQNNKQNNKEISQYLPAMEAYQSAYGI